MDRSHWNAAYYIGLEAMQKVDDAGIDDVAPVKLFAGFALEWSAPPR